MSLEKIKEIAEQMPESPEKQSALQAYSNLKTFEVIADSFESVVEKAAKRLARTGSHKDLRRLNKAKENAR